MLRLVKYAGIALIAVALVVAAIVVLAPAERFRPDVVAAVRNVTGRTLAINGGMHFTFTPALALVLNDVALPGAEAGSPPALHADTVTLSIDAIPLLSGTLKVSRVTLDGCTAQLQEIWKSAPPTAPGIGDLTLSDCKLMWAGAGDAQSSLDIADLRLRWPQDGATLNIAGAISFRNESLDIEGLLERPGSLIDGGHMPVRAKFSGSLVKGSIDGDVDVGALKYEGGVNLTTNSVRRLALMVGVTLPGDRGLGEMSVTAAARLLPGEAHFHDAKFTLDGMTGGGALGIEMQGGRPDITGSLEVDRFDLATYLSLVEPDDAGEGWSAAEADLGAAGAFDLDLGIKAKRATLLGIEVTDADLSMSAVDGTLGLTLARAMLNGGSATAQITADTTATPYNVGITASLSNADAGTALPSLASLESVTGRISCAIALQGRGRSQRELMQALSGSAEVTLRDGSITGIDLAAIGAGIASEQGFTAVGEDQATNFSSLAGKFQIADGVARSQDVAVVGPFVRFTGRAAIGLPGRLMQVLLAPNFVGGIYGETADRTPGHGLPFIIAGPFDGPVFVPDYADLVQRLAQNDPAPEGLAPLPEPLRTWLVAAAAAKSVPPHPPALPGAGAL